MKTFLLCYLLLLGFFCVSSIEAALNYEKEPDSYASGNEIKLRVYLYPEAGLLTMRVRKNSGVFLAPGTMRIYKDGSRIASQHYDSGDSSVYLDVPLDFTDSTHEYRARADTADGSGNRFWSGTVTVWGDWESNPPDSYADLIGSPFEDESYSSSSNPTLAISQGASLTVALGTSFNLNCSGSNLVYRYWESPSLEIIGHNSSLSRITLSAGETPGSYLVTALAGTSQGKVASDTIEIIVYDPAE